MQSRNLMRGDERWPRDADRWCIRSKQTRSHAISMPLRSRTPKRADTAVVALLRSLIRCAIISDPLLRLWHACMYFASSSRLRRVGGCRIMAAAS